MAKKVLKYWFQDAIEAEHRKDQLHVAQDEPDELDLGDVWGCPIVECESKLFKVKKRYQTHILLLNFCNKFQLIWM